MNRTKDGLKQRHLLKEPSSEPPCPTKGLPQIVAIGTSAGGLEALELFFGQVPEDSKLAFIVIQHLDPSRKGLLVDLLQRGTPLPVREIHDIMKVESGHVYVIPPNKDISLLRGIIHLLDPAPQRGLRLPIDFFFRSLADDLREYAIGVILSGMGSDGTLGLRAIKENAGTVFVQDPVSAKFDAMPRSAIDAGLADVVAPPDKLPGRILEYLKHVPAKRDAGAELVEEEKSALDKVIILLRAQTRHDFSLYKKSTIFRRVERRMGLHQLSGIEDYLRYLRENPQESELLFKELLIGVTSFFRDPVVWKQLKDKVLPALLSERTDGGVIRAWVTGCSTGEEAYSLAIVIKEVQDQMKSQPWNSLQIFATDLDKDAIQKARAGSYPENIAADVSEDRLRKFFTKDERGYSVSKSIRDTVTFAPQNLVMDPPFTKLDILTCRNLLIYLDSALQKKLFPLFHYSLNSGGILLLGSSETVGQATDLFSPLEEKTQIYRRLDCETRADRLEFPSSFSRVKPQPLPAFSSESGVKGAGPTIQAVADRLLLQSYSPAAVVVTDKGDIVYISGKTGKYLEPAAGKVSWNLFAMARPGLDNALVAAFHKANREKITVTLNDVKVGGNGGSLIVDVVVHPFLKPESLNNLIMVVFLDRKQSSFKKNPGKVEAAEFEKLRLDEQAQGLEDAHEEVRRLREEMQSSEEELKSYNEEMQSSNEELQSTNEELTTSKEEMQSMNEEMQTVNHELQAKLDELSQASNDMKNLLNSTGIATLFLDDKICIRRFTVQTTSIIKLIPTDAGRPLTDIATELDYPLLANDARQVLRTRILIEKEVKARDGRWFTVRMMPYHGQDNQVDGLVITFYDITTNKNLEAELREVQAKLQTRFSEQSVELDSSKKKNA